MVHNIKEKISIIVPCYNVEEYLPKCIDSILNQTYKNLEILLVDDGSPDRCGEICDEYAKKDSRIKVIHKSNGGLSDARNVAIDIAEGEFLTFIDSDDYVTPNYVELLYNLIVKYKAQMSVILHQPFYEGTEPIIEDKVIIEKVFNAHDALISMFYQKDFDTAAWCKMYHKSLFKTGVRYPKGWLYEDLPTTYRLIQSCSSIAFSTQIGLYYQLRKTSIEGAPFKTLKYLSCKNVLNQLEHDYSFYDVKLKKALACRIVSFAFHILLEIPSSRADMQNEILKVIKKYRTTVLISREPRFKVRFACLISYGGISLVNIFSKFGKSR